MSNVTEERLEKLEECIDRVATNLAIMITETNRVFTELNKQIGEAFSRAGMTLGMLEKRIDNIEDKIGIARNV